MVFRVIASKKITCPTADIPVIVPVWLVGQVVPNFFDEVIQRQLDRVGLAAGRGAPCGSFSILFPIRLVSDFCDAILAAIFKDQSKRN